MKADIDVVFLPEIGYSTIDRVQLGGIDQTIDRSKDRRKDLQYHFSRFSERGFLRFLCPAVKGRPQRKGTLGPSAGLN